MTRGAWRLTVREGQEAAYREAHRAVWPELIEAARAAGLRNQSVYMDGRTLFVYAEADDLEASIARVAATAVKQRWNEAMSALLEPESVTLDEVFHVD